MIFLITRVQIWLKTFGSYIFKRRSDVDLLLLCPGISLMVKSGLWMELLERALKEDHLLFCYKCLSGSVTRMAVRFIWSEGCSVDVDLILLPVLNSTYLTPQLSLRSVLEWTVNDMQVARLQTTVPISSRKALYDIAVKNTCIQCCTHYGINVRQFGYLLTAARIIADRCNCMGTVRTGLRPYLLSLSLVYTIEHYQRKLGSDSISLDEVFLLWVRWHAYGVEFREIIKHLRQCYPNNTVPDMCLLRLNCVMKKLDSFQDLMSILGIINLPKGFAICKVCIRSTVHLEPELLYAVKHLAYGIISKYGSRMVADGNSVFTISPTEPKNSGCLVAEFGMSHHDVDYAISLFPAMLRIFNASINEFIGKSFSQMKNLSCLMGGRSLVRLSVE